MSHEYKYLKYKKKYTDYKISMGGKCSMSDFENLKIIKGHGKLFYDPFIIPKDTYVINFFQIGYDTPMIPTLELEILEIFKQNKEKTFFDFSKDESTEREHSFEQMFIKGIIFNIQKYKENTEINNQIIIFDNELCGIYCSNNTFSKCMPVIYGKNIFNKLTNKHCIYRNSVVEQTEIESKYITFNFELDINNEKIFVNCNVDDLNILNIRQQYNTEDEKYKLLFFKKMNRIKIILFYVNRNNFFLKTSNLKNKTYNDKTFSFVFDEKKLESLHERYPVKINNEILLIKGENLYLYWNQPNPISIENIMSFEINIFLNSFALNTSICINDIDETKYIENKYNKYLDGIFININDDYNARVNIMKTEIYQINLMDLINLEGSGKYFLYTCRSCEDTDINRLKHIEKID